jgi:hypothetical protein
VAVASGAWPGREAIDEETARLRVGSGAVAVGSFWVGRGERADAAVAIDRWGDVVVATAGDLLVAPDAKALAEAVGRRVRHRGPVTVQPTVWVLHGNRVDEIDSGDRVATAAEIVRRAAARQPEPARPAEAVGAVVIVGSA